MGTVFFLGFYMVSVYCVSNLFICVILAAFEMAEGDKERLQINEYRTAMVKRVLHDLMVKGSKDKTRRQRRVQAQQEQAAELMRDEEFLENIHVEEDSDGDEAEEEQVQQQDYPVLLCLDAPMPNAEMPDRDRNLRYVVRAVVRSRAYNALVLAAILFSAVRLPLQSHICMYVCVCIYICIYIYIYIY